MNYQEVPSNLFVIGDKSYILSDNETILQGQYMDKLRAEDACYTLAPFLGGFAILLSIPFLFFCSTQNYALMYIFICICLTIVFRIRSAYKLKQIRIKIQKILNHKL